MALDFWRRARDGTAAFVDPVSWFRGIVVAQAVVFLLFAVALTIAPQATLSALAGAAAGARDISLSYRPVVALVGLLLVAATVAALWAMLRAHAAGPAGQPAGHEKAEARTTRPAA